MLPIRETGANISITTRAQVLMGSETGLEIGIGQRVTVRLSEAVPLTGGLMLELLEVEGRPLPQGSGMRGRGKGPMRKRATQARLAEVKRAQKRRRVRRDR
ncbi:hypothetical protein [Paracoccus mutanolyticus]|uniref:hypothetical protein n=1 Tax=Paracoccus mutanolyticus TaxID=1499308 RepID=UPI0011AE3745|nr:hypothetical protein [Paracoccus mutanolyticus]